MDKSIIGNYIIFASIVVALTGCGLTFQNIDTHGPATDLVDETETATPTISPTLNVPIKPL